jgi:hypothetical protein
MVTASADKYLTVITLRLKALKSAAHAVHLVTASSGT